MSDTENMEKEFTVDELAGGESLVDDLTDDEYVEALGEHDGDEKAGEEEDDEEKKEEKGNAVVSGEDKDKNVVSIEGEQEKKDVQENNEVSKQADKALDDDKRNLQYIPKKEAFYEDDEEVREEEEDGGEDEEEDDDEEEGEEEETVDEGEDGEEDEESIEGDQEENDGQENNEVSKQADKALDDDEDRRNPQYIPKRGAFYEHDDRLGTDDEVDEEKEPEKTETLEKKSEPTVEVRKTKKLWSDDGKWGHDMFDTNEQKPKPRDEIISTYGYDIRNEDGPPKARRRRRYGRGPNRYTRSWKDEGAYSNSNETPNKGKVKADENTKREKEQGLVKSLDSDDKRLVNNRRSGSRGRGRNEPKTVPKGSDREKEGPGLHHERERERDRDLDRDRDHRKYNYNRSPGPSKDHREAAIRSDRDLKRNQKDFSVNDFPELPLKSREKIRPMSHVTTGELNQPNAWSKSRPKPSSARENIRDSEGPEDYKTEPMKVVENGKRTFNLSDNNSKIEIVKTQTFENSRYFSRRNPTKGHHPEPTIVKKDAPLHRSNRGRNRPIDRDFRNSGELGRPITKTSHLSDDYEVDLTSGSGSMEQQRRGRYNMSKDRGELRDFRGNLHDDRDRRGSDEPRGRNYNDDRHYDGHFNETQADISVGLSKLTLDKSRLAENDPNNLSKPKRYSSLRQHQTQIQQQHQLQQSEPLPQHQHPQQQQQQHKQPQQQQTREIQNSTLNQYPSTSQHLNLNHSRQSANVQYYEANSGANQQPSASYYIDNRSPQSSFGFIPTTNIEGAPNSTRFLSQIAPRFIPPPPAPPPPPPEPRFMAQAVAAAAAANPATAGTGTLPSVISGPPAATYLPTYPPGYPQYPPPPPQAAQFSIAPPPPPAAPEMYRGGVTYYDTMTQQVSLRQLPQRRPKNALPIVPPSDLSNSDVTGYDDQNDLNQNVETVSCLCE